MNFSNRLKFLRTEYLKNEKNKKLTRKAFGEKMGVSEDVIKNLEYNRVEIKDHMIKLICQTFNVREEWLRDGVEPIFSEDKENRNILEDLERQGVRPSVLSLIKVYLKLDDKSKKVFDDYLNKYIEEKKQEDKKNEKPEKSKSNNE